MAHDGPLPGDVLAAESTFAEALRWVSGEAQVTKWCRFVGDAMRESVAGTLTLYKLLSLTSQADRSDEERTRIWQDVIMSADHVVRAFDAAAGEHEVPAVVGQQLRQGLCAVIAMSGAAQASHAADEQVCRCPLPPTAALTLPCPPGVTDPGGESKRGGGAVPRAPICAAGASIGHQKAG